MVQTPHKEHTTPYIGVQRHYVSTVEPKTGIEPVTSPLPRVRSNHLSYNGRLLGTASVLATNMRKPFKQAGLEPTSVSPALTALPIKRLLGLRTLAQTCQE